MAALVAVHDKRPQRAVVYDPEVRRDLAARMADTVNRYLEAGGQSASTCAPMAAGPGRIPTVHMGRRWPDGERGIQTNIRNLNREEQGMDAMASSAADCIAALVPAG